MTLYNKIIKHDRSLDVCYEVIKCFDEGYKLKLKVNTINMGFKQSWSIGIPLNFTILKDDLKYWWYLKDMDNKCFRYGKWIKL